MFSFSFLLEPLRKKRDKELDSLMQTHAEHIRSVCKRIQIFLAASLIIYAALFITLYGFGMFLALLVFGYFCLLVDNTSTTPFSSLFGVWVFTLVFISHISLFYTPSFEDIVLDALPHAVLSGAFMWLLLAFNNLRVFVSDEGRVNQYELDLEQTHS